MKPLNSKRCHWLLYFLAGALCLAILILHRSHPHGREVKPLRPVIKKGFFVLSQLNNYTGEVDNNDSSLSYQTEVSSTKSPTHLTYFSIPSGLPTWKPDTFCDNFIGHTFRENVPMCGATVSSSDSVKCLRNPQSTLMIRCTVENLAIDPKRLHDKFYDCEKCNLAGLNAAWLLSDKSTCPSPSSTSLERTTEDGDYQRRLMKEIIRTNQKPSSDCKRWVNETAYILTTHPYHIFFRFYSYFNLHKTLLDTSQSSNEEFVIVRISDKNNYMIPEYEKRLFPELVTLNQLHDVTTCFKKVVFSPWTYSCVMFRCKMEGSTRGPCLDCNGRHLYGTDLMSFRIRAISACSLEDEDPTERAKRELKSLVIVLRKPYHRWDGDFDANFQRVLSNSGELIAGLKQAFPSTNVTAVYMEKVPVCEQIRLAHNADVLMGVHGAGLVHLWWLQEDALLFELVPYSQAGNPSFKTLARLSGRSYHGYSISGSTYQVSANTQDIVNKLKSVSNLK